MRRLRFAWSGWLALVLTAGLGGWDRAAAQLNEPTLELFQRILPSLDDELKGKFEAAIDSERSWIEFSPDEFLRFRENPANPFDGLDSIDPHKEPGKIRLEFKVPSPRERVPITRERQHRTYLQVLDSTTLGVAPSVARVYCSGKWVALATAVNAHGLLVTKASELCDLADVTCRFSVEGETRDLPAVVWRVDESNDLALLKVEGLTLQPVTFYREVPEPGRFVTTCDETGTTLVLGVVSTRPRCLTRVNQAYLGVRPVNAAEGGVELVDVTPGGAAESAGLLAGDRIVRLDERAIQTVTDLVNAIRLHRPGASITIDFMRDGERRQATSSLAARNVDAAREPGKQEIVAGAIVSARHDDFPLVFQHDSPLLPEYCGGPLVDLDGRVLGINIARSGRVASLAIGGAQVELAVDRLLRENVASRDPEARALRASSSCELSARTGGGLRRTHRARFPGEKIPMIPGRDLPIRMP